MNFFIGRIINSSQNFDRVNTLATPAPHINCPSLIIHGKNDTVIQIESSRNFKENHQHVQLIEVDDDHQLISSLPLIYQKSVEFFNLNETAKL